MSRIKALFAGMACLGLAACGPGGGMVDVSASNTGGQAQANRASTSTGGLPAPAGGGSGEVYRVRSGDVIEVNLYQLQDLNRVTEVDGAGNINLALVGAVPASGRTVRQLEQEIGDRYRARYLQNPQVSVSVRDSVGLRITVDGAVKKPGVIMARGDMTLLRVLAESQGFTDTADQTNVVVIRAGPQGRVAVRFDANAIRSGTVADPSIFGGDTVVVDDSTAKTAWKHFREAVPAAGLLRVF